MATLILRFCLSLVTGLIPSSIITVSDEPELKIEPSKNIFTTGWAKTILKRSRACDMTIENSQKWKFNMCFILDKGQSGHRHINCFWVSQILAV